MALPEYTPMRTANLPVTWPEAPPEMSVTTLAEVDACPRRWALGAASYPEIWDGRGYPPRARLRTLAGTVVHLVLETITRELVRARCPSVQDPAAISVMRVLGGYTKIVNDCIDRVLERLASNPRATHLLEYAARSLRGQVPDLRTRAQTMLCRVRLARLDTPPGSKGNAPKTRRPLSTGAFPEIDLYAKQIGWKGKADLLVLSASTCEISDFKTGAPVDWHRFQIQVYALLWNRDVDLNPERRRADRLLLCYSNGDVEVAAPSDKDLDELENQLVARRDAAHQSLSRIPPVARPDSEHCRYCGVRQLCGEYWTADTQRRLEQEEAEQRFGDAEVTIVGRHGPSSWDVRVGISRRSRSGKPAVLRTNGGLELRVGARLRVLDATITVDVEDDTEPVVITLGTLSEAYVVA